MNRINENRLIPALINPNMDSRPKHACANKMMYAHENAVENMVLFARLLHVIFYTFGVSYLRTIVYFTGWLAQTYLAVVILLNI